MGGIIMNYKTIKDASAELRSAMESSDTAKFDQAMETVSGVIAANALEELKADYEAYQQTGDEEILRKRGCRQLTSKETAWYNKLADVMRSSNPKQVFVEVIGSDDEDDIMPSTILEDVFRNLTEEHPLLSKINTQNVGYLTKWILNNHTAQTAVWGAITAEITQEITSDLKVVDIKQNKLSCFVLLEKGMEDMGPTFLDSYIREVMYETMAATLEVAVISGTGEGMPTGMDRSLLDADYTMGSGYAQKTAVPVTDFTPASYGELVANLSKDETGKQKKFGSVVLICNQTDYLTKIMPATTVLNANGSYVNNLFPFATEVIVSNAVADDRAILGIIDEYTLFIGKAARNNVIEYSDDYKFLEDYRTFKIVQYADGRAVDNTSFELLDISGLEPAYLTVKDVAVETA